MPRRSIQLMSTFAVLLAANAGRAESRISLDEAVRSTLRRDPNIQIQEEQVKFSEGTVVRESGKFDTGLETSFSEGVERTPRTLSDRLAIGGQPNIKDTVQDITNQRLALNHQFRTGPSVSTGVELNRIKNNLDPQAANRASVNFVINVPLLKFGPALTAANEKAAKIQREATVLDLTFVIGQRLLNTASAYWDCLGAEENLKTLKDSAERAKSLLDRVKQLVAGNEIPAAELRQTEADLSGKLAQVRAGEQRFIQARQAFGLALGLDTRELSNVPLPDHEWPTVATNQPLPSFTGDRMIERSLNRRADFQSARKSEEAAEVLTRAAKIDLRPNLDLSFEGGYAGLSEGAAFRRFYSSIDPRAVDGPNAVGTLKFSYPLGNHSAKGLVIEREALRKQAELRQQNLARTIGSAIMVAFSDLDQSSQEVAQAREALGLYRQTVDNEREKLRIGASTIIDVITIEDRLDTAAIRATDALVRYATALTRIRYETGMLPATRTQYGSISVDELRTPPRQADLESTEVPQPATNSLRK